jgi:hypothetical protein
LRLEIRRKRQAPGHAGTLPSTTLTPHGTEYSRYRPEIGIVVSSVNPRSGSH